MICLKYTKISAEVLLGKMRLKYNFTSFTIYCEMSVLKNSHVRELLSRQYSFLFTENISTSSAILNIRSRERKFEQRLARGLFWSRLLILITIPDWQINHSFLSYFFYVSGVNVCIFVALYLCNFVSLYVRMFVARANKVEGTMS